MLVVIVLIALLSSLGYGGWQHSISKARSLDAQQSLFNFAATLERCYQQTHNYIICGESLSLTTNHPILSEQKYYYLTIKEITATSYVLRATPIVNLVNTAVACIAWELHNDGQIICV